MLHRAVVERLGPARLNTGCRLARFAERGAEIVATFERRDGRQRFEAAGDALVGADGIHSAVRAQLLSQRGPAYVDRHHAVAGCHRLARLSRRADDADRRRHAAKFVLYPIHHDPARPRPRLTNWAVQARIGDGSKPPPRREDWNRPGRLDELLPFVRDSTSGSASSIRWR